MPKFSSKKKVDIMTPLTASKGRYTPLAIKITPKRNSRRQSIDYSDDDVSNEEENSDSETDSIKQVLEEIQSETRSRNGSKNKKKQKTNIPKSHTKKKRTSEETPLEQNGKV